MSAPKTILVLFLVINAAQPSLHCMQVDEVSDDSARAHRLDDIHEDAEIQERAECNRKFTRCLKNLLIAGLVFGGAAIATVQLVPTSSAPEPPCSLRALCLSPETNLKGRCWSLFQIDACNSAVLLDQGQCPERADVLVSDLLKTFDPQVSASLCVKAEPCLQSVSCGQQQKKVTSPDTKKQR